MAEANPLAAKIGQNLLQCAICHEQYQDPRGLPCQHGFCRECLEDWAKKNKVKGKVVCPICRDEVSLPKEGVQGLPVHFLVSSLKDICEEVKQVTCSNCNTPGKKAKFHCFDCREYMCEECHAHHKSLKLTKHHKVAAVEDFLSGKVSDEGRYCKVHGNVIVEFYCETEQKQVCSHCISLKTCPIEHERTSLKDAAKKQITSIEKLIKECDGTRKEHQNAVQKTEQVQKELQKSKKLAESTLAKVRRDYILALDGIFKKDEAEIMKEDMEKMKKISSTKQQLEEAISKIDEACQKGSKVIQSGSEYVITSTYASLTETLLNLNQSQAVAADGKLGHLRYLPDSPSIQVLGHLSIDPFSVNKLWKLIGQFCTAPGLTHLKGVAVNQSGDIAVTSCGHGVRVFTRTGQVKCVFKSSPSTAYNIAVMHDNRYIIEGDRGLLCYDNQGNQLSEIPTYDMKGRLSGPIGVAVDTKGRIIAGLATNSISIYHADGTFINRFATQALPRRLAVTAKGQFVLTSGGSLKLIEYPGNNVRDIQPPTNVKRWSPNYICSNVNYGEIFVSDPGDSTAVYRYTSGGEYLGPVATEVNNPAGLAISEDGQELFVAEYSDNLVKIFQRQ